MKTKNLTITLPIFTGFYNTTFEPDNEGELIDDHNAEYNTNLGWDDFEFAYNDYMIRVSKSCAEFIDEKIKEILGIDLQLTFESINKPQYYNFRNDKIESKIKLTEESFDIILDYLVNHEESFSKYVVDKFTSCDGFISFWSNDATEWFEEYLDFNHKDLDFTIGECLNFILQNEEVDDEQMYYYCTDNGEIYLNYTVLV